MNIETWKELVALVCAAEEETLICSQLPHGVDSGEMIGAAYEHLSAARRLIYAAMLREHPKPYLARAVEPDKIETLDDVAEAIATTDNQTTERKSDD
jgi:hypothetical protein